MSYAEPVPGPPPVDPADRPIQLRVYEADNVTHVADLTTDITGTREWMRELPGIGRFGSGSFEMPLYVTADDLAGMVPNDEVALLTRGRVVRFYRDGVARFAAIIRPRRQTSVSTTGYPALKRSLSMQGLLSEWDRAVLPPAPGAEFFDGGETRNFGWMSAEADVTSLDTPTILRAVFAAGHTHPDPWIDAFGSIFDASTHRYFIFDQTIDGPDPISLSAHLAAADQVNVWLNSCEMGSGSAPPESSWDRTLHGAAKLPAGTHRWGFEVVGLPDAPEPRFAATAYEINDATTGQMLGDTILWRTGYITGTTLWPGWKASATAQGPTAKQIIRSVLTDIQTQQGLLLDWELDGEDDTIDANGNALPRIAHVPFPIGCKAGSDFLVGMARAWCDLRPSVEGKTLSVYRWRESGTFWTDPASMPAYSDARFAPLVGRQPNIVSLTHEERQ